jgi:hypothetical protein
MCNRLNSCSVLKLTSWIHKTMAESLGGSRGKGSASALGYSKGSNQTWFGTWIYQNDFKAVWHLFSFDIAIQYTKFGHFNDVGMNASKREGGGAGVHLGMTQGSVPGGSARGAGSPGGMGYNGSPARPNSAPRERPGMGAATRSFGSPSMDAKVSM